MPCQTFLFPFLNLWVFLNQVHLPSKLSYYPRAGRDARENPVEEDSRKKSPPQDNVFGRCRRPEGLCAHRPASLRVSCILKLLAPKIVAAPGKERLKGCTGSIGDSKGEVVLQTQRDDT